MSKEVVQTKRLILRQWREEGHPLRRHVLYRLERKEWQKQVDMS